VTSRPAVLGLRDIFPIDAHVGTPAMVFGTGTVRPDPGASVTLRGSGR
jgi:hypothetical protein